MDNSQISLQTNFDEVRLAAVDHYLENIKPTATEICHLWSSYMAECMSVAFLKHMVAKAKDSAFHNVLQIALITSIQRVESMENLFKAIQHPIPYGFGEEDVETNAPQLFSEEFCVLYTQFTSKYILIKYSFAFSDCTRSDFRQFVKSDEIRDYLNRGLKMADKQLDILASFLHQEGLPGPEILDCQVTDSVRSPYSDRLILYHVTVMIAYIVQSYGHGITGRSCGYGY